MKIELDKNHNEVPELGDLDISSYENIFNMYKDEGEFFAYNILRSVHFPNDMDNEFFYFYRVENNKVWTRISFDHYGTIQLWWLICLVNKIMNPVTLPDPGTVIRVLKPQYVSQVLEQIATSK
jgi:hypothetical protein